MQRAVGGLAALAGAAQRAGGGGQVGGVVIPHGRLGEAAKQAAAAAAAAAHRLPRCRGSVRRRGCGACWARWWKGLRVRAPGHATAPHSAPRRPAARNTGVHFGLTARARERARRSAPGNACAPQYGSAFRVTHTPTRQGAQPHSPTSSISPARRNTGAHFGARWDTGALVKGLTIRIPISGNTGAHFGQYARPFFAIRERISG